MPVIVNLKIIARCFDAVRYLAVVLILYEYSANLVETARFRRFGGGHPTD
jgi:hypothetical protein